MIGKMIDFALHIHSHKNDFSHGNHHPTSYRTPNMAHINTIHISHLLHLEAILPHSTSTLAHLHFFGAFFPRRHIQQPDLLRISPKSKDWRLKHEAVSYKSYSFYVIGIIVFDNLEQSSINETKTTQPCKAVYRSYMRTTEERILWVAKSQYPVTMVVASMSDSFGKAYSTCTPTLLLLKNQVQHEFLHTQPFCCLLRLAIRCLYLSEGC